MLDAAYRAAAYAFRLRTALPEVAEPLGRYLEAFRTPAPLEGPTFEIVRDLGPLGSYLAYLDGELVQRSPSAAGIVDFVLWVVTERAIETDDFLVVHAGVVSWEGRAVLMAAPPDFGKTSLTAALTARGFGYLSDEAALFRPGSTVVYPLPRSLWVGEGAVRAIDALRDVALVRGASSTEPMFHVHPEDLRPGAIGEACPVGLLVFPAYAPGERTRLEPVSKADALVRLTSSTFNFEAYGRQAFDTLALLVAEARAFLLPMGDLDEAVRLVEGVVGRAGEAVGA
jgi:hypothetical protein